MVASDGKKTKKKKNPELPEHLELQRTRVVCGPDINSHVQTTTNAFAYMPLGFDNSWDFEEFKENLEIKINFIDDTTHTMEFEILGVDPAIANALRRILIAEIPTMAIEHVFMINNTSIIQDEVFCHRLGLIPLRIDPRLFEFKTAEEAASEKNTVVFKLDIKCRKKQGVDLQQPPYVKDVYLGLENGKVTSGALTWLPDGSEISEESGCRFASGQSGMFTPESQPRPVDDDILLAKLRPGQEIVLEAHCTKGIGKEHAKWSPVATCWYRYMPEVVLLKPVEGALAEELVREVPGLFELTQAEGKTTVIVNNPREHEKQLEKIRRLCEQDKWAESIQFRKKKDHFIFTIESTGVLPPDVLLCEALDILVDKCNQVQRHL